MAILAKKGKVHEGADNIFWTTMADLMLGLAIIFMTLFILAMTGFTQDAVQQKQEQIKASQEMIEKLEQENIQKNPAGSPCINAGEECGLEKPNAIFFLRRATIK